jgi:hypothetical protein
MQDRNLIREEDLGWVEFPPGWSEYQQARDRWLSRSVRDGLATRRAAVPPGTAAAPPAGARHEGGR